MAGGMSEHLRTQTHRRAPWRRALWAALLTGLAVGALAAAPGPARADDPVYVRLYYSQWMTGRAEHTPADPSGAFTGSEGLTQNPQAGLEAIFLRRIGLSYVRQKFLRAFTDTGATVAGCSATPCLVSENGVAQSVNLSLYARPVYHQQFNAFAGGGAGYLDYSYTAGGAKFPGGDLFKNLSLSRWFFGAEYTFDRIGFRIEVSRASATKAFQGQKANLDATYRYLTLVIPLN